MMFLLVACTSASSGEFMRLVFQDQRFETPRQNGGITYGMFEEKLHTPAVRDLATWKLTCALQCV